MEMKGKSCGVGSEAAPAVQGLVMSLVSEELIGQEQAGVSSHKGDWSEGEMTEQKNIPASPGTCELGDQKHPWNVQLATLKHSSIRRIQTPPGHL